jgi:hypothetical protein
MEIEMKLTILATSAIIGAIVLPSLAFANTVSTVQGCAVIDMGGYSNKVDPTCTFNHQPGGGGTPGSLTFADLQGLIDALDD